MLHKFYKFKLLTGRILNLESKLKFCKKAEKHAQKEFQHEKSKNIDQPGDKQKENEGEKGKGHKYEAKGKKKGKKSDFDEEIERVKKFYTPRAVNIGIIGAHTRAGMAAALYLKQNTGIRKLLLHGNESVPYIAKDLNGIDTRAIVKGYCRDKDIKKALRAADIVIIIDLCQRNPNLLEKFENSAVKLYYVAQACAKFCPRAFIINCVEPVCCTMPLVVSVMKQTPFYHPGKIAGCVSPLLAKINAIAADYLNLEPETVHVPLLGGPCPDTLVPVVSLMEPNPMFTGVFAKQFFQMLVNKCTDVPCELKKSRTTFADGYAIAQFAVTVARGMTGNSNSIFPALVRCNIVPMLKYCSSTVRFGYGGIVHNFGVPRMSRFELEKFDSAITHLQKREKMVNIYIKKHFKSRRQKCASVM